MDDKIKIFEESEIKSIIENVDEMSVDIPDSSLSLDITEGEIKSLEINISDDIQDLDIDEYEVEQLNVSTNDIESIEIGTFSRGLPGVGLNYKWVGTNLGVKRENEENYHFIDLKGAQGKNLEFVWSGTKLGIRVEGQSEYQFVDLQGDTDCTELSNIEIADILK